MSHLLPLKKSAFDLPYELEQEILELSARAHPQYAPQLTLISRYVQTWIEAVIYETVVLGARSTKQDLFWRTFSSRPPEFFSKNIRNLHLTSGVLYDRARQLISVCTSLCTLTCWANPLSSRNDSQTALQSPFLRRLSIDASILWPPRTSPGSQPDLTYPVFTRLTHLEIVNPPSELDWAPLLSGLLPCLTHLAFGDLNAAHAATIIDFFCDALVSEEPRLQTLIAVSRDEYFLNAVELSGLSKDPRFVCLPSYHHPLGPAQYWQGVAQKEIGFWSDREPRKLS
ncbi:hypothetical protein R3P38DRAFT_1950891 [Favolaschia claudopus]|uniref:Maturase K n=1 Tax=Favolaschia claudopus TaxID=2862362 RepID=A0AAW0A0L3_9AGAR